MTEGGVEVGLPAELAAALAAQTVAGAAEMVLATGETPAVLRDRVTSPGGTTLAGLKALEENGFQRGRGRRRAGGDAPQRRIGKIVLRNVEPCRSFVASTTSIFRSTA